MPKTKQLKQHTQDCGNQDPVDLGILNLSASLTNTNTDNTNTTEIADISSTDIDSNTIANIITNLAKPTETTPNMALSQNNRELLIHIESLLGKVKTEIV